MLGPMGRLPEVVETPRLVLRRWRVEDAPRLQEAVTANVEHLRPWMEWIAAEPMRLAEREALILGWEHGWLAGGDVIYGVWAGDEVVGGTGLHRRLGPDGLEIGYWIHVDHLGLGYATELARALTATALAQPGVERVEIHHDEANVRSGRVPQRLGYTRIGVAERQPQAPAEVGVEWMWRMTTPVWMALLADGR